MLIAIDGACKDNGKPDCISTGAFFTDSGLCSVETEYNSTNQRGEIIALRNTLKYINEKSLYSVTIITDSEYVFNAVTKDWLNIWLSRDWYTSLGEPVKNADLWKDVKELLSLCVDNDVTFIHTKGHCLSIGKVTEKKLIELNDGYSSLLKEAHSAFSRAKQEKINKAIETSIAINGFQIPNDALENVLVLNTAVDAIASYTACREHEKYWSTREMW